MDIHFNSYKLRYVLMNQYMRPIRNSQVIRNINIFINLDDLFHKLHRPIVNKEFQCCSKNAAKQLTSNIFNLIGHYKNWAVKEGLSPTIYLVYTTANHLFKNSIHIKDYRSHYFYINSETSGDYYFINTAINASHAIIPVLAKYLKGVYAIDSKYLEPSAIPFYISEKYPADWNLLVSRDEYDLQYCYKDRWSLIYPKGDNSSFITRQNMWDYIINKEKVNIGHSFYYDNNLFPTMKAIAGDKYRNIPKLKRCGWKTIFGYVEDLSKASSTSSEIYTLQQDRLCNMILDKHLDVDAINRNLYCVDVVSQVRAFMDTDRAIIDTCINDMEDFVSLNRLNGDIFREFPLNLNFLCREVKQY